MSFASLITLTLAFVLRSVLAQNTTVVNSTKTYSSVSPTWQTSPYFRAGNKAVISTLTGNSSTPVFTFTFSSPLSGLPNLAYGIKNYRGDDLLGQEFYEIKKIGLTSSTFTVQIQIFGFTNIWLLNVAYLAVEPAFPHHFNTFDNVPLNYSSGNIVNISAKSSSIKSFTQYINYTQQAASRTYKTFTQPLSSNVIVLFMTSLWIRGTFGQPVQFHITPAVINSEMYKLTATAYINIMITNVHFSQVIFNKEDIERQNKYQVVYYEWISDMHGGWRVLPAEFVDNFIMGVNAFETLDANCTFEYQWEFANSSGVFGVEILTSWTLKNTCGFSWSQSSVLYISTWLCPFPNVYFNITTQMCQNLCGGYFFQEINNSSCSKCSNPKCYICDVNDSNICLDCAAFDHMILVNRTCQCMPGYFYLTGSCVTCSSHHLGCTDCSYGVMNTTTPFNSSNFQCFTCNQTQNYFLVNTSCVICSLSNCVVCSSMTACQTCATNYSINYNHICSQCAVLGCWDCVAGNNSLCDICYNAGGFFLVPATQLCTSVCGDGLTAAGMEGCDDGNTIDGDGCSSTCVLQPFFNCTMLSNLTTVCLSLCGDGVRIGTQACDDGNNINGDGCNQFCQLEVVIALVGQSRNLALCNSLKFQFDVTPHYSFMDSLEFSQLMILNSSSLINSVSFYINQHLTLSYEFDRDMIMEKLGISPNSTLLASNSNYTFIFTPDNFQIYLDNNVPANYLNHDMCSQKQLYETGFKVLKTSSYLVLFISLITGKIIGLQLFGVLQLAYFSIGSIDSVNVLLSPLMSFKDVNGYSVPFIGSSSSILPRRVKDIQHYPSFLDNFNVMFLLMFVELLIGLVLYIIVKLAHNPSKKLVNISNRLLKEVFLTLVLFNCFNISYSFAVYYKFTENIFDSFNIAASSLSLAVLVLMGFMVSYADPDGFGEFKDKFKQDIVEANYMTVSLIYRTLIGFLLGFSNNQDLSTLFALGVCLFFLLYNLINLPFVRAYHNYRACLCHFTHFVTLFVAMYYRSMKSTTSPAAVAGIYSPAKVEFAFILASLIVSAMVLLYDSYSFIRDFCKTKIAEQNNGKKQRSLEISRDNIVRIDQHVNTEGDIEQTLSHNQTMN